MGLNVTKNQLRELRYCASHIQQAMTGGKGFITVETLDSYIKNKVCVETGDYDYWLNRLRINMASGNVSCLNIGEDIVKYLNQKGFELAVNIKEFDISQRLYNCLARNDIMYVADILKFSEDDIARFRNMGTKSLEELKQILSKMGLQLFTQNELGSLARKEFDFYLERRTISDLSFLGINDRLIDKIVSNKLLHNGKRICPLTSSNVKNMLNDKNVLAGVPDGVKKYVALGVGELIKQDIDSQIMPLANSDRIIRGIIKPARVYCKYQKKNIFDCAQEKEFVLTEIDKDKTLVYLLDEEVVVKYQEELWAIITYSNISKAFKAELLEYIDKVCFQHKGLTK